VAGEDTDNDVSAFLAVLAALLLDNVLQLDETVGRVTDFVMSNKPDRDTIVTLQSFDRIKQEFEALGDALARYAQAHGTTPESGAARLQLGHDVISGITVADLKDRLLSRLVPIEDEMLLPEVSAEQAAEVGVDVLY
jgi:hypothetical protein